MLGFRNKCPGIRRLLSERLDAPLSPRQESMVHKHLETCADCRQEAALYANIKSTAASLESRPAPEYLWERISVRLDEHPWGEEERGTAKSAAVRGRFGFLTGSINLAGAALSLALIAVLFLMPGANIQNAGGPGTGGIRAEVYSPTAEYVSLYMLANSEQFPDEVRAYYLSQLEGLDLRIRTIKSALQKYPHNRQIRAQLARAYSHKIDIFRQVGMSTLGLGRVHARHDMHRPGNGINSGFEQGGLYE